MKHGRLTSPLQQTEADNPEPEVEEALKDLQEAFHIQRKEATPATQQPASQTVEVSTSEAQTGSTSQPAAPSNKRQRPFADLVQELQHEVLSPSASPRQNDPASATSRAKSNDERSHQAKEQQLLKVKAHTPSNSIRNSNSGSSNSRKTNSSSSSRNSKGKHPAKAASPQPSPPPPLGHRPGRIPKQYKAVLKGDLSLPGGPLWSPLRRHVMAAGQDPMLPTLKCIILVEGDEDHRAVARAVNATVSLMEMGFDCSRSFGQLLCSGCDANMVKCCSSTLGEDCIPAIRAVVGACPIQVEAGRCHSMLS